MVCHREREYNAFIEIPTHMSHIKFRSQYQTDILIYFHQIYNTELINKLKFSEIILRHTI